MVHKAGFRKPTRTTHTYHAKDTSRLGATVDYTFDQSTSLLNDGGDLYGSRSRRLRNGGVVVLASVFQYAIAPLVSSQWLVVVMVGAWSSCPALPMVSADGSP